MTVIYYTTLLTTV